MLSISKTKIEIAQANKQFTTAKLAEVAGMRACQLYTTLSRGSCRPETAGRIAAALGVPVAEILGTE